jgi:hypothetical protein
MGISEDAIINEGKQLLQLNLKNTGTKAVDSLSIYWSHNNAIPDSLSWNDTLAIGGASISIDLDSLDLLPEKIHELRIWVGAVAGDTVQGNDTLKLEQFFVNPQNNHYALYFDGGTDYMKTDVVVTQSASSPGCTFEAWVNPVETRRYPDHIMSTYNGGGNDWSVVNTDRTWRVLTGNGLWNTGIAVSLNTWQHIAVTFDPSAGMIKFYKNGKLRGTSTNIGYESNTGTFTLATTSDLSNFKAKAYLDEVRVWRRVRSEQEIREWMVKATGVKNQNGLEAVWHFSENVGGVAFDFAGFHHATFVGASWAPSTAPVPDPSLPSFVDAEALSLPGFSEGLIVPEGKKGLDISIKNNGLEEITSLTLDWRLSANQELPVDSQAIFYYDTISPGGGITQYAIDSLDFTPAKVYALEVSSSYPNSKTDTLPHNDTARIHTLFVNPQAPHYAMQFNGSNYLNTGINLDQSQGGSGATLEAWVYPTASYGKILFTTNSSSGTQYESWGIRMDLSSQNPRWVIPNGGGDFVSMNQWQHIAAVFDPGTGTARFFKNGIQTAEVLLSYRGGQILKIAETDVFGGSNGRFQGLIDEARVWDRPLSQAEIRKWMVRSDSLHHAPGLRAVWHFHERQGNIVYDFSNGNHAMPVGSPAWVNSTAPVADPALPMFTDIALNGLDGLADFEIIPEGMANVNTRLENKGLDTVRGFDVNWLVNGFLQAPKVDTSLIPGFGTKDTILVDSFLFLPDQVYDITLQVDNVQPQADTITHNNALTVKTIMVDPSERHYALDLTGTQYLQTPISMDLSKAAGGLTIEAWVKPKFTAANTGVFNLGRWNVSYGGCGGDGMYLLMLAHHLKWRQLSATSGSILPSYLMRVTTKRGFIKMGS